MKNKLIKYSLIFLALMVAGLFISYFRSSKHETTPELRPLHRITGEVINADEWKGKRKVLYFWATWCGVCRLNLPLFKNAYSFLGSNSNTLLLSIEEGGSGKEALKTYMEKNQIHFPVYIAGKNLLENWKVEGFPTTIYLNEKDEVKFIDIGILNPFTFYFRYFLLAFL
ncbi:MAG: TlpA family protein disulfide reductase [Leptospiraceae bacterium]|nr:TlpA family protein disulfide reductase [Leptospiraceae bacterium]MCP5501409.1 TlpA family protein disulfide reductase [Leptospiraceae bacterium]